VFECEAAQPQYATGGAVCSELDGESDGVAAEQSGRVAAEQHEGGVGDVAEEFDSVFGFEFVFDAVDGL
jgi:hypothetical protein